MLSALLYDIQPTDPATYVTVSSLLLLVATAATLVPAWRAIHIDPASTLRTSDGLLRAIRFLFARVNRTQILAQDASEYRHHVLSRAARSDNLD